MEHFIEGFISNPNLKGVIFGFVHASITIIGYYSGLSVNRLLKIVSKGYIAGIFGAALSHVVADLIASMIDPHLISMALGIVVGGIIPLLFIPILEKYFTKSKNHIVVGDHEDVKKDLDSH